MRFARRCMGRTGACFLVTAAACGPSRFTVGPREWEAYRETRVAPAAEERLRAAARYLESFPGGAFHDEVEREQERLARAWLVAAHDDAAGLEVLLSASPPRAVAEEASGRLQELRADRARRLARERRLTAEAAEVERRLALAEQRRKSLVREVAARLADLAATRSFGRPTSELPHELLHAFRSPPDPGRCVDDLCRRSRAVRYAVPDGGRVRARVALLDLEITLDRGMVARISLGGPELWTRVGEALRIGAISPDDAAARADSLGRVAALAANAVEEHLPAARCAVAAEGVVLLHRRCDGRELVVVAARSVEEDDRVEAGPEGFFARPAPAGSGAPPAPRAPRPHRPRPEPEEWNP